MGKFEGAEYYLSKQVGKAIVDYEMLSDGDRIAVAVSGGKDSLSLLKVLIDRQSFVPIKYKILALHVDLGYPRSCAKGLENFFKKMQVDFHIEKNSALKKLRKKDINCFWCSWNRRKSIFETAHRLGINKIALGHHKDDIVETILMNMFFNGEISAMLPRQVLFRGDVIVIRPLAYVEERLIQRFVQEESIPTFDISCPNSLSSSRAKIARIIQQLEKVCPDVKTNIFRSLQRIKKDYLL